MKTYTVYLFRAPDCVRGWLPYVQHQGACTVTVELEAPTSAKAKNSAVTAANNGFEGVRVVKVGRGNGKWHDADRFPELNELREIE